MFFFDPLKTLGFFMLSGGSKENIERKGLRIDDSHSYSLQINGLKNCQLFIHSLLKNIREYLESIPNKMFPSPLTGFPLKFIDIT